MSVRSRVRNGFETLGIGDRETLSWAMYDWANSAFATTILAAVLPVYYTSTVAAELPQGQASALWAYTTAIGLAIVAIVSPAVGAVADHLGAKKRLMAGFVVMGVVPTGLLFFIGDYTVFGVYVDDTVVASGLFVVGNIGFAGGNALYDSLLPHITDEEGMDRLSAAGYALGYLGGGVLLVVNLAWILSPETFGMTADSAARYSFVSVAVWWLAFSLPVFVYVDEPDPQPIPGSEGTNPVVAGFSRLRTTLSEVRDYRQLMVFLVAFWLYSDGIGSIIKLASAYATDLGLGRTGIIGALVLTQFAGIPFAFAFGKLADRISTVRALYLGLGVYVLITIGGFFLTEVWQFWVLAFAVAMVQGGTQALSRSLFGAMVPDSKTSEFFGFFSVSSKFAGIAGPLLYGITANVTGSARLSILVLVVFFVGGIAILTQVDVEEGKAVARYVEERGTTPDREELTVTADD